MDKAIDARFERIEKALAVLIESIAKYTPSLAIGHDLVLADHELSEGLRQVETHQNNVLRIHQLRAASASLDDQIRDTLRVLASTRKDMTATSTTVFPDRAPNPISFEELLSFARRISKTTMPPAGVTNGVDLDAPGPGDITPGLGVGTQDLGGVPTTPGAQTPSAPLSTAPTPTPTNGAVTPGPTTPGGGITRHDSMAAATDAQPQSAGITAADSALNASSGAAPTLPEDWSNYLKPHTGEVFFPWPHDDLVRSGALNQNWQLLNEGIDIKGYDPVEEQRLRDEAALEAKRAEEERRAAEQAAEAERARRRREELERHRAAREREQLEAFRRGSIALDTAGIVGGSAAGAGAAGAGGSPARPSATSPAVKQQFQFMGDDDDDDDDDSDNALQD